VQAGALFGITSPVLSGSQFPTIIDPITKRATVQPLVSSVFATNGLPYYTVPSTDATFPGLLTTCSKGYSADINAPNLNTCQVTGSVNTAYTTSQAPFKEVFGGNSARPRISVGAGVNWNSPFGPLRIDLAYAVLKDKSDDSKLITFNVGTQF
ncbi:MAG: BamA/TamA family outer membrane protein, partial [Pseudomonadota bacterium]